VRTAFIETLCDLAGRDPRIWLLTGDLGYSVLERFAARFPDRYVNMGVAEQNMAGVAAGLALEGRVVFTYSIANFPTMRCLEQVRNDACYHAANVKIVGVGGGFSYGALGISHHATEDLSIMRALPNLTVVAPGTDWEAAEAAEALALAPGTGYLRLERSGAAADPGGSEPFVLGRARRFREGADATLIAAGGILTEAVVAAAELSRRGIECRVLSMHTVKPLDRPAILAAVRETGGIVTVEENTVDGGLGAAVAEVCLDEGAVPRFFRRVGLRAGFSCIVGSQQYLRTCYGMDAAGIRDAVLAGLGQGAARPSTGGDSERSRR